MRQLIRHITPKCIGFTTLNTILTLPFMIIKILCDSSHLYLIIIVVIHIIEAPIYRPDCTVEFILMTMLTRKIIFMTLHKSSPITFANFPRSSGLVDMWLSFFLNLINSSYAYVPSIIQFTSVIHWVGVRPCLIRYIHLIVDIIAGLIPIRCEVWPQCATKILPHIILSLIMDLYRDKPYGKFLLFSALSTILSDASFFKCVVFLFISCALWRRGVFWFLEL